MLFADICGTEFSHALGAEEARWPAACGPSAATSSLAQTLAVRWIDIPTRKGKNRKLEPKSPSTAFAPEQEAGGLRLEIRPDEVVDG